MNSIKLLSRFIVVSVSVEITWGLRFTWKLSNFRPAELNAFTCSFTNFLDFQSFIFYLSFTFFGKTSISHFTIADLSHLPIKNSIIYFLYNCNNHLFDLLLSELLS